MTAVQPYLIFDGNCEEAVNFYCQIFGGKIQFLSRFKDSPVDCPAEWKEKIMHVSFMIKDTIVMASDTMPHMPVTRGNNVFLSVGYDKKTMPDDHFNQLAQKGNVMMKLEKTFWGARFGQLTDRYGINWMFNQQIEEMKMP